MQVENQFPPTEWATSSRVFDNIKQSSYVCTFKFLNAANIYDYSSLLVKPSYVSIFQKHYFSIKVIHNIAFYGKKHDILCPIWVFWQNYINIEANLYGKDFSVFGVKRTQENIKNNFCLKWKKKENKKKRKIVTFHLGDKGCEYSEGSKWETKEVNTFKMHCLYSQRINEVKETHY